MLYNNTTETYDDLLVKTSQSSMEIKCLRTLPAGIFKTLNDVNLNYMKEIFHLSPHEANEKHDLFVYRRNTTKYGNHSLEFLNLISGTLYQKK